MKSACVSITSHLKLQPPRWCRSRKTLIYLILTLNHCYPDYDFSLLRANHFCKEPGVGAVEEAVDSHLLEVSRVRPGSVRARGSYRSVMGIAFTHVRHKRTGHSHVLHLAARRWGSCQRVTRIPGQPHIHASSAPRAGL